MVEFRSHRIPSFMIGVKTETSARTLPQGKVDVMDFIEVWKKNIMLIQ
jgi:hypothetical protein